MRAIMMMGQYIKNCNKTVFDLFKYLFLITMNLCQVKYEIQSCSCTTFGFGFICLLCKSKSTKYSLLLSSKQAVLRCVSLTPI